MIVATHLRTQNWDDIAMRVHSVTPSRAYAAIHASHPDIDDFIAMVSPAAEPYLEIMAQRAKQLSRSRFGNTVSMFVPLYLSNLCANECTYCGFTMSNRIKRKTLTLEEVDQEAQAIKSMGFSNLLLVTGEHETKVGMAYFKETIPRLKRHFPYLMMEVQPLSTEHYRELKQLGINAVLVYQETYHARRYAQFHLRGNKQDFDWRLETSDRLGIAGMDKIGIGALLGLADWRTDSIMTALHASYLQKTYWRSRVSIAFPRLRPCAGGTGADTFTLTDRQLVQLICAHRILHPQAELSLSTRESAHFRDNVIPLGITSISAGSQTQPGGYSDTSTTALSQFDTEDNRPAADVAAALVKQGLEPVWTDWLAGYGKA
ncbi:2-iminoacetate synthase ThiH [Alteromonas pelagimontana]|uniref:2-iminoacetate synthase ThiH n=1 Tax=Alteromonas pelagimontana TaxID=1858656 RepID=A0A6M4ME52_9ALTE|nr:2-iminoacetate synthase ThiH [Alteromonas pelagimontana]QJR81128.1 2-iminoacetate synthase ThiH [Alteromonas pelagimontana]